ncbi:CIR protein PIR protein [Plasmodium vinckei vinckei]|uniref:CIR protein PIR protein n=1 Tax=Plasmodium vinckei vinckei TaxID=54757 RepID=A0A449BTI9_PLAVN|nr:CIR protein PIR protein [Plasmodium vinckei vinckei]VEV56659.1 CIR protein PIR protein [Plasmodium vinckei vinckei]
MAKSPYSIEDVYKEFGTIDSYFYEDINDGTTSLISKDVINNYCHYENKSGKNKCNDYFEMTSSSVIHLLEKLKDKKGLDYDKLAEYAILWLSFKLNKKPQHKFAKLNEFYTKYIETNNDYNKKINDDDDDSTTYKDIIDTKKDLIDMDIEEISKFDGPFSILYYFYYAISDVVVECEENLNIANSFVNQFKVLNNDSNNIENSSYNKILSTLSDDYNNLINNYDNIKSCNFLPPPELTPQKSPVGNSGQHTTLSPEATPSNSSILNTVIPGLSTFFVIPVFFGIAYKTIYKRKTKKNKEENET